MKNLNRNPYCTPPIDLRCYETLNSPESPKKRRKINNEQTIFFKPIEIVRTRHNYERDQLIGKLLNELEYQQKAVSTDNQNRIILHVKNRNISTDISATLFLKTFKNTLFSEQGEKTLLPFKETSKESLIFLNTYSKKRQRTEISLFYVPSEIKAEGGFSKYKEILKIGSEKIKGLKKIKDIELNYSINREQSCLKALHERLPIDKTLSSKGLKHLGIQDAFKFGLYDSEDEKNYAVGTAFQCDAMDLKIQGVEVLLPIYQLAFGLKFLHDNDLFEHDIKAPNVFCSIEEKFPLRVRAVLADLNVKTKDDLRSDYENKNFIDSHPFGTWTRCFQPKNDIKKMVDYHQAMRKDSRNGSLDFEEIFKDIVELRKKNMVSLLGQTFFQILTCYSSEEEWPEQFISNDGKKTLKSFRNKIYAKILANQKKLNLGVRLTKEERLFCGEITDLVIKMTDLNHENRPSADEILKTLLNLIKNHSYSHYEMIMENRWSDGYADWTRTN